MLIFNYAHILKEESLRMWNGFMWRLAAPQEGEIDVQLMTGVKR
jgi:hypothetical protein